MITIGIIGLGGVGEILLNSFENHPHTKVNYIYDTNHGRLQELADKYQIQSVSHYRDILAEKNVDLVYLAVPPKYHHSIALDIIRSGKKFCVKNLWPILLRKPRKWLMKYVNLRLSTQ